MGIDAQIRESSFIDNTAYEGGAICLDYDHDNDYSSEGYIYDGTFDGNIAFKGSAIYLDKDSNLEVGDTTFGKNRANSTGITIDVFDPVTYYPGNTAVNVTFRGNDNIANAVWNDGDKGHVKTSHITYEAFIGNTLVEKTTPSGLAKTYSLSEVTDFSTQVWQDDLENAQLLNITISKESGEPISTLTNNLTDVYGNVTIPLSNLPVGKYKVHAERLGDRYYTSASFDNTFEVINGLNVTKTSYGGNWTDVGSSMEFLVNITNNGPDTIDNITIIDNIPEGFNQNMLEANLHYSAFVGDDVKVNGNKITYSGKLMPGKSLVIKIRLRAEKSGIYNNTILFSTDATIPITVVSDNVAIYNPSINITKKAVILLLLLVMRQYSLSMLPTMVTGH